MHIIDKYSEDSKSSSNSKLIKNYRIKNPEWHCQVCDIFCNSHAQFEVHMISQKHKLSEKKHFSVDNSYSSSSHVDDSKSQNGFDENNNLEKLKIDINNFSLAESHRINAHNYLIPESKRVGKFEKFGFYCGLCNAYMTGQIQLVMHVKGARHQFYSPGEIPGYSPAKIYNPGYKSAKYGTRQVLSNQNSVKNTSVISTQKKNPSMPSSTPVKTNQQNGSYADYLLKNQNLMQSQYFARYYSNNFQTPVYNQFSQQYTTRTPPTPMSQNQPNGNFFGSFVNQTSPPNIVPNPNYQLSQQFRVFPNQSNLIVVKNDNYGSKASSYNSNSENCLNRSFEKNFPAYNSFESPVFNLPQTQVYSNGITIQPNQSPQVYYQTQKNNNGFFSTENSSSSSQLNLAYYQNYSIIS